MQDDRPATQTTDTHIEQEWRLVIAKLAEGGEPITHQAAAIAALLRQLDRARAAHPEHGGR